MKIGIDARFVGPQGTGLGKYTEKLILNLCAIDKVNEYLIFLSHENWDYLNLSRFKNFRKVLANIKWYSLDEQLKLLKVFKKENLDLLHVPHFNVPFFYRRPFVVTIHDLIHHHFQETSATTRNPFIFKLKRLAYRKVIDHAINKSKVVITPSNFVKNEIVKNFAIDTKKIVVTYEAAEEEYFGNQQPETSDQLLKKYKIRQPFLIYVGNAYPHKNLSKLLEAFALVVNLNLVIVSARDVFTERLQREVERLGIKDRVVITGYIQPEDLSPIFRLAKAYVFPSLSEGFGIPGLNAMAAGLPVACSNIPVLKEVYGDAAFYFDPNDVNDIASKVKKVLTDEKLRSNLIIKGKDLVKKYSWRQMAKETLTAYRSTL